MADAASSGPLDLLAQINAMSLAASTTVTENKEKKKETEVKINRQRRKSKDMAEMSLGFDLIDKLAIKAAFEQYDTDGSGDIDLSELKDAVKDLKGVASSSLNDKMFTNIIDRWADWPGKDEQGHEIFPKTGLTLAAFEEMVKGLRKPEEFEQYDRDQEDILADFFTEVDADKSGWITEEEFIQATNKAIRGGKLDTAIFTKLYEEFGKDEKGEPTTENGAPAFSKTAFVQMLKAIKTGAVFKDNFGTTWKAPGPNATATASAPAS